MKIAFSNILWGNVDNEPYFKLLSELGVDGVEIAPSVFWPEPIESTRDQRIAFRGLLDQYGLELVGFHALLYSRPDLNVLGTERERTRTKDYLTRTAELCHQLGGKILAFGGKRALGVLPPPKARAILETFCRELAVSVAQSDVTVCVEPLSRTTTELIQSLGEGHDLVRDVNHPNFMLMCDAKSVAENGEHVLEEIQAAAASLRHFHINDYGNTMPGSRGIDHALFGCALKAINYPHYVSVEVSKGVDDVTGTIRHIKTFVDENYFDA